MKIKLKNLHGLNLVGMQRVSWNLSAKRSGRRRVGESKTIAVTQPDAKWWIVTDGLSPMVQLRKWRSPLQGSSPSQEGTVTESRRWIVAKIVADGSLQGLSQGLLLMELHQWQFAFNGASSATIWASLATTELNRQRWEINGDSGLGLGNQRRWLSLIAVWVLFIFYFFIIIFFLTKGVLGGFEWNVYKMFVA